MQRYKEVSDALGDSGVLKDSEGKRRYSSIRYPVFPFRDSDIYIYTRRASRLDLLAWEFYNDQTLWPVIAEANNIGKGTLVVPIGVRLRIPFPVSETDFREKLYEVNEIR